MENLVLPVNAQPTDVLANRFSTWRKVIRGINIYLREFASVQEEIVRQNVRLSHAMSIPFLDYGSLEIFNDKAVNSGVPPKRVIEIPANTTPGEYMERDDSMFLPYGNHSLGDVPADLINFHRQQANAASKLSKELTQQIIPRLEDLRRDLLVKLKEIKNLASDFKNSVSREQGQTAKELAVYNNAIQSLSSSNSSLLNPKHDPYLLKVSLDRQIARQVNEENYLLEAFLNLQGSGRELEYVVAQEVQQALNTFGTLFKVQAENILNLVIRPIVEEGFCTKEPTFEWDAFVKRDPNFVDTKLKPRKLADIHYEHQHSALAHQIKAGYLERRSKYLKSYSKAWYVLTPGFLHEFKSSDQKHDPFPVMSLSLDECQLSADSKSSSSQSHKFILNAKGSHKWVFRTESQASLDEWFNDLRTLTSLNSARERAERFAPPPVVTSTPAESTRDVIHPVVAPIVDTEHQTDSTQPTDLHSPISNTSEVTSNGEPFDNDELESRSKAVEEEDELPTKPRGRFGSEVNLEAAAVAGVPSESGDEESVQHVRRPRTESAAQFLPPQELKKLNSVDDNASVFSYDLKKKSGNTLADDADFEPVYADVPVEVERRLTLNTNHKEEEGPGIGVARQPGEAELPHHEALLKRRSSTLASVHSDNKPVRRATGSFGAGADELKPLTNSSESQQQPSLFFANGLPSTTSSGQK